MAVRLRAGKSSCRKIFVQERVAEMAKTGIEFPPMQKGVDAVKEQIQKALQGKHSQ
jgi:arylsulfatase